MKVFKIYLKGIFVIFMVVIVSVMLFKMIKNVENKISKPNLLEAQEYIESTKFLEDDAIDSDYEEA